jgi:hypothetical protein
VLAPVTIESKRMSEHEETTDKSDGPGWLFSTLAVLVFFYGVYAIVRDFYHYFMAYFQ